MGGCKPVFNLKAIWWLTSNIPVVLVCFTSEMYITTTPIICHLFLQFQEGLTAAQVCKGEILLPFRSTLFTLNWQKWREKFILCPRSVSSATQSAFFVHSDNWYVMTTNWASLSSNVLSLPPVHWEVPTWPHQPVFPSTQEKWQCLSRYKYLCLCILPGGQGWEGFSISLPVSHILGTADSTTEILSIVQSYSFSSSPQLYLPDCLSS